MPTTNSGDESRKRILLAFYERYTSDRDNGNVYPLSHYLALHPEHEDLIVTEYTRMRAESDAGQSTMVTAADDPFDAAPGSASDDADRIGPYDLVRELGRGGQGVVYLAKDRRLGRKIALKILEGLGPDADRHIDRFQREAKVASKLDHPGICGVHDAGVEGGVPYIAMRYVQGETLAAYVNRARRDQESAKTEESFIDFSLMDSDDSSETNKLEADGDAETRPIVTSGETSQASSDDASTTSRNKRTSITKAQLDHLLHIFEQAARALHAAHEAGIIHRDIKPGNIMLDGDSHPVILDFGLARDDSTDGPSLTQTGDLFGTPAYMSPEQIAGAQNRLDRRSDVYSLGVSLYECLTLTRPFEAATREALYRTILEKEAAAPRKLNRSIPRDLEVVVETALCKDRDRRYATAEIFADDLRAVRKHLPIVAKPIRIWGRMIRFAKRRPAAAALLLALAVGVPTVAALGGYIFANQDDIRRQKRTRLETRVESLVAEGFYLLNHSTPEHAEANFKKAHELLPDSIEALGGLAMARRARHRPQEALDLLGSTNVSSAVIRRIEVAALKDLGRDTEAAERERNLSEDAPRSSFDAYLTGQRLLQEAHRFSVNHHKGREALRESQRAFNRAIVLSKSARLIHYLGYAHAVSHLPPSDSPSPIIDGLLRNWPDQAIAWYFAGEARHCPETALAHHDHALKLDSNAVPLSIRVRLLAKADRLDEALIAARKSVAVEEHAIAHANLAAVLLDLDRNEQALLAADKALVLDPTSSHVLLAHTTALGKLGRFDEALVAATECVRRHPLLPEAQSELGRIAMALGRGSQAVAACRRACELRPDIPVYEAALATAFLMIPDFEAARPILERLAGNAGIRAHASFWLQLSNSRAMTGDIAGAETAARKAIELDPEEAQCHADLARALYVRGKISEAESVARTALRLDANSPDALGVMSGIFRLRGDQEEAITLLERALAARPNDGPFNANLGMVLIERDETERGLRYLERGAATGDPRILYELARVQGLAGEIEACMETYRRVIALVPNHADAHYELGEWHSRRGEHDEAVRLTRQGHELGSKRVGRPYPSKRRLRRKLAAGAAAMTKENPSQAATWWTELLELYPDDVVALRSLAALRLASSTPESLRDEPEALGLAARAVRTSRRRDPRSLDILAHASFRNGLTSAAIEVTEELIDLVDERDIANFDIDALEARLEVYRTRNSDDDR